MYYTVYKITNLTNNKFYIGKHKTNNLEDGYMGSGKLIRRAIKKYGIENFVKEILFVLETEEEMNDKEKEVVLLSESSYNLCPGGQGGFGYINTNGLTNKNKDYSDIEYRKKISNALSGKPLSPERLEKLSLNRMGNKSRTGQIKSEIEKQKQSLAMKGRFTGEKNSQFGTCWITNEVINKKHKRDVPLPPGWRYGQKPKI